MEKEDPISPPVSLPRPPCFEIFEDRPKPLPLAKGPFDSSLTVMSYNILCDSLVERKMYRQGEEQYLDWPYRLSVILSSAIRPVNSSLLLLQEVQSTDTLLPAHLSDLGYSHKYVKRLEERDDGLLTAYKKDQFSLIAHWSMGFTVEGCHLLNKPNVTLFVLLKCKKTQQLILTVNCHVLFNKNRGDIKFFQISLMMKAIRAICDKFPDEAVVVIWSGDFNTTPCSPLYKYFAECSIDCLSKFQFSSYTGQNQAKGLFHNYKGSIFKKFKLMNQRFDEEIHRKYFIDQRDPDAFDTLFKRLKTTRLSFQDNKIEISYAEDQSQEAFNPLKMKSAYCEDYKPRCKNKDDRAIYTGEIMFSSCAIQEEVPLTVDYIL